MNTTTTRIRRGFKQLNIEGYTNYAINRQGVVYRIEDDRQISPYTNKAHWSGNIKLTSDNGDRFTFNIANLVSETYNIRSESALRRLLA